MKKILNSQFSILRSRHSGQAMILAVMALGGTILGATAIGGLLMTYQIRQTTNAANSAKAVFAADSGLECGLYNRFKDPTTLCPERLELANGAVADITCYDSSNGEVLCNSSSSTSVLSKGTFGTAKRAFLLRLR